MALGHGSRSLIELQCPVRTGPFAVTAAHAFIFIDQDDPIFPLRDGSGWANVPAYRFYTVIASDGKIVGKDMRDPGTALFFPGASGYLINTPPIQSDPQIVFILACHLAGFAARTPAGIEVKGKLFCHFFYFYT
jgi:hypothetical protein